MVCPMARPISLWPSPTTGTDHSRVWAYSPRASCTWGLSLASTRTAGVSPSRTWLMGDLKTIRTTLTSMKKREWWDTQSHSSIRAMFQGFSNIQVKSGTECAMERDEFCWQMAGTSMESLTLTAWSQAFSKKFKAITQLMYIPWSTIRRMTFWKECGSITNSPLKKHSLGQV